MLSFVCLSYVENLTNLLLVGFEMNLVTLDTGAFIFFSISASISASGLS